MSDRCTPMPEEEWEPCVEHGWSMAGLPDGARCIEGKWEDAEAALRRVQELCSNFERLMTTTTIGGVVRWVRVDDIDRALDGGSDNCNANLGMADYPWWQQREGRVDD